MLTTPHSWVLKGKISSWWRLTWKRFRYYWPFVRGIHRKIVDPTHKGSVMWILDVFFDAGWLVYDVTVMTRILGLCASCRLNVGLTHYSDVIMTRVASQITGASFFCSIVCSCADQRKHQSSASLASVRGIQRWLMDSPHKGPVTRKMFPFDDVVMDYSSEEGKKYLILCNVIFAAVYQQWVGGLGVSYNIPNHQPMQWWRHSQYPGRWQGQYKLGIRLCELKVNIRQIQMAEPIPRMIPVWMLL